MKTRSSPRKEPQTVHSERFEPSYVGCYELDSRACFTRQLFND
jgi:hypothetical protein